MRILTEKTEIRIWPALLIILLASLTILWFAPLENSLGTGILYVYVHVALILAGKTGLILTSVAGLLLLITGKENYCQFVKTAGWVAVAFYAVGTIASMFAAIANWGEMFFAEPRYIFAVAVTVFSVTVLWGMRWVNSGRQIGALAMSIALFLFWADARVKLVLHPENPIGRSNSGMIKMTFLLMYLLALAAAGLYVYRFYPAVNAFSQEE